jgi:hypothetical protein
MLVLLRVQKHLVLQRSKRNLRNAVDYRWHEAQPKYIWLWKYGIHSVN